MKIETFDMYGEESINNDDVDGINHSHSEKDKCHRCDSTNTEIHSDCVSGAFWWMYLKCNDCNLCCIFGGDRED